MLKRCSRTFPPGSQGHGLLQDPLARDELLEDIFDGLELLRESNMLADWLVASIAALILSHPKVPLLLSPTPMYPPPPLYLMPARGSFPTLHVDRIQIRTVYRRAFV